MLNIKNLEATIDNKHILRGLNLDINPGEVHAIMGPNGSGKSTLANVLSGKNGYDIKGDINFNGNNLSELSTEERAQTRRTYSKYYKTTVCTCILSLSARY